MGQSALMLTSERKPKFIQDASQFRREIQSFLENAESLAGNPSAVVSFQEEFDRAHIIKFDLKKFNEDDLLVGFQNGRLSISLMIEADTDSPLSSGVRGLESEVFSIPPGIDLERVDARFKDGVLTVILPKLSRTGRPSMYVVDRALRNREL